MIHAVDTRGDIIVKDGEAYLKFFENEQDLTYQSEVKMASCDCEKDGFVRPVKVWSDGVNEVGFHDCKRRASGKPFRRIYPYDA